MLRSLLSRAGLIATVGALLPALQPVSADWKAAEPGWRYEFPRDHGIHPDFKTEWWYFTGNVRDSAGREFGYQLTFFRQGVLPPERRTPGRSRFLVNDFKFAHFAVSELTGGRFHHAQKVSRGAFGEAGFADGPRVAWIDNWALGTQANGSYQLAAGEAGFRIELDVAPEKAAVIHGQNGVSQKAASAGHASHYYSFSRMRTTGRIVIGATTHEVTGESWFDHEWATNQLAPEQSGWNWFSVQFEDGTELMLYQMRLQNGGIDPSSSGTWVAADGATRHLTAGSYQLQPLEFWKSAATGGRYPVRWKVTIPELGFAGEISTPLAAQELVLKPIAYWEGAIRVQGTRAGQKVSGKGYMELTGYSGALTGLRSP
jgi:predicted secreted hydrolase